MNGIGVRSIFGSILVHVLPGWDGGFLKFTCFLIIFTKSDLDYLSISLLERMNISLVLLIGTHRLDVFMFGYCQASCLRRVGNWNKEYFIFCVIA